MDNKIFIGDNLIFLSEQKEKFKNKINMIYIDPPYNTNNKKSYNDNINSDIWYKNFKERIKYAYEYLTKNGIIFISIDDSEFCSVRQICNEIFGKQNFIGTFITKQAQRSNAKLINTVHEYIVAYSKNIKLCSKFSIKRVNIPEQRVMIEKLQKKIQTNMLCKKIAEKQLQIEIKKFCAETNTSWLKNYNCIDDNGNIFFGMDLSVPGIPRKVDIESINLHLEPLKTRSWVRDEKFIELHQAKRLAFKNGRPYAIKYLFEAEDNAPSILNFYSRQGTHDLNRLGLQGLFDTPKPVDLVKFLIRLSCKKHSLIMDFYGGSGTTAQAVYEINNEDKMNHKYILVQINEEVKDKKVISECKKYNIEPSIDNILKLRIDTYLKKFNKKCDYELIYLE